MLLLIRHGETETNKKGLILGRGNPQLTKQGRDQATRTSKFLAKSVHPTLVLSSPLTRAMQTATELAMAFEAEIVIDERLIEIDFGDLEGRFPAEVHEEVGAWMKDINWRPPNGETLAEVAARVESLLDSLTDRAVDEDVILVSHVSPIKAATAWALRADPAVTWQMSLGMSSITKIAVRDGSPMLISFGETAHLHLE